MNYFWTYVFLIFGSFLITACTVGPDYKRPAPPHTQTYVKDFPDVTPKAQKKGQEEQHFNFGEKLQHDWWTLFKSKPLNKLIEKALAHSPTLEAAEGALKQAQENVAIFSGNNFYPSVDLNLGVERQKVTAASSGTTGSPTTYNLWNPSLNMSYTFDLFGGQQRGMEALLADVDYQQYLWEAAHLTLVSTLITTLIQEASLREQINVIQKMIDVQMKILEIMKAQLKMGGAAEVDILTQETLLAQTQALLPTLEKQLYYTSHAISVLVGEFPEEIQRMPFTFKDLHLPRNLPIQLPASLVRKRPDIKASEALLKASNANIGVAQANFFPTLTLTGSVGTMALSTHDMMANSATVWSLGSSLLLPLFKGGALTAEKRAMEAAYDQAFANYRQTVLTAFQEVADALRSIVQDAKNFQLQNSAQEKALKTFLISERQFKVGGVPYLSVLNAEIQYLQTLLNTINASALRFTDTVALFQALGGGWEEKLTQENQTMGY
ncbi:MAG: efflux transporter outer membrane subunit [Proteobacteria bacterium]|nr:efflux transporter outer membrane subunit [Pseudomonadota bacterium]